MELKNTEEQSHEIITTTDIEDFLTKNKDQMLSYSLPEYLNMLLSQKGVVRGSRLDRAYIYHIFRGENAVTG